MWCGAPRVEPTYEPIGIDIILGHGTRAHPICTRYKEIACVLRRKTGRTTSAFLSERSIRFTHNEIRATFKVLQRFPEGDPLITQPPVQAYLDKYVGLARRRLPQLAEASTDWWLTEMPFFGGLRRQRIWTFWRRVLHTCHHRTQIQTWLRLAGQHVPAIYGPSGDVKWDDADPTYYLLKPRPLAV